MRHVGLHSTDLPRVCERMEIDGLQHIPKPPKRQPFDPATLSRNQVQRPQLPVRRDPAPPAPHAPPTKPDAPLKPAPRQDTSVPGLSRVETQVLQELWSCLKLKSIDIDTLRAANFPRVLEALGAKL